MKLVEELDRFEKALRAEGYQVKVVVVYPYNVLLIKVHLSAEDSKQLLSERNEIRRVGG